MDIKEAVYNLLYKVFKQIWDMIAEMFAKKAE